MVDRWRNWQFKNTAALAVTVAIFFYLLEYPFIHRFIAWIGELGLFGAFMMGIFFVSSFTFVPVTVVLLGLGDVGNPFLIALAGGLGAMVGDYVLFRFFRDRVFDELAPVFYQIFGRHLERFLTHKLFSWTLPVVGAFIIASPLPDEVGIAIMGLSHIKRWQFLMLAFALNVVGIYIIVLLGR